MTMPPRDQGVSGGGDERGGLGGSYPTDPFSRMELRRSRLSDIQGVARSMREDVAAPDLTAAILDRVGQQKPFVDESVRRWVVVTRVAMAISVAMVFAGVALIYQLAPQYTSIGAAPRPLTDVVDLTQDTATERIYTFKTRLQSVADVAPAVQRCLACEPPAAEAMTVSAPGVGIVPVTQLAAVAPPATTPSVSGSAVGRDAGRALRASFLVRYVPWRLPGESASDDVQPPTPRASMPTAVPR